jgi:hypothetical protein
MWDHTIELIPDAKPANCKVYVMDCLSYLYFQNPNNPNNPIIDQLSVQSNQDTVLGYQTGMISFPTFGFLITPLHSYTPSFTSH